MAVENGRSALEQMNQILADKEAVIDKKKQELANYRNELSLFEQELRQKAKELQESQAKFKADEEAFQSYKQSEEEKIAARWREIAVYESNLESSMEEVLEEKVRLEAHSVELLEKELEEQDSISALDEKLNLSVLRQAVGIETANVSASASEYQEVVPEMAEGMREVLNEDVSKKEADAKLEEPLKENVTIPELFVHLQKDIEKQFKSKRPYAIEVTSELLCMQVGTMELRVYNESPYPKLHLVVNYKNASTDAKLQKKIGLLARVIPDWQFITESTYFVAEFLIEKPGDTKAVALKVKECIEKMEL